MDNKIIYETKTNVLFSHLVDGKFEKKWKHWTLRVLQIRDNGTLVYKYSRDAATKRVLDLKQLTITYIPVDFDQIGIKDKQFVNNNSEDIGFHCECKEDGFYTAFKCVMPRSEIKLFCEALMKISVDHNIHEFLAEDEANNDNMARESSTTITLPDGSTGGAAIASQSLSQKKQQNQKYAHSVMRRSIAAAIDKNVIKNRNERIIARRGAFRWLPVAFTNDLVHGSW